MNMYSSSSTMPMSNTTMPSSATHRKMMMHMTFFWGRRDEVLFSGFPGDRGLGIYLLALFLVFMLALIVELLSYVPVKKGNRTVLTGLTAIRQLLSYTVMLSVMSFNVGVLIVAVLGHAIGFFLFGTGILFKGFDGQNEISGTDNQNTTSDSHQSLTNVHSKAFRGRRKRSLKILEANHAVDSEMVMEHPKWESMVDKLK